MSELESGFRLADAVALVKRQLWIVAIAAAVGAVAGYLVLSSAPTTYSATARVAVGPDPLAPTGTGTANPNMETEREVVKSEAVAETVRKELGRDLESRSIFQSISVLSAEKSTILQITYQAGSGAEARDGANATAAGYLADRKARIGERRDAQAANFGAQITAQQQKLAQAQADVDAAAPGSPERATAQGQVQQLSSQLNVLQASQAELTTIDLESLGTLVRKAPENPALVTSKKALGTGAGVFGLFVLAGLGAAWLLDRRDTLGGGRRRVEQLLPGAGTRLLPGAEGRSASPAELDTAIDRMAVELVAGGGNGQATAVLVIGASDEPPVALAEELASSLTFAGIPALFVLAGTTDRQLRHSHVVTSFADLLTGPSVSGPASLPAQAGAMATTTAGATVTWLRPRGSAESSGLLRRAVVDTLVARAGRERFEAVVFVTASPARTAAGTALGRWVRRTALVVGTGERAQAEEAARALADAGVAVSEVVWT